MSDIILIYAIALIYVFPVSSLDILNHYNVYQMLRLLFIGFATIILIMRGVMKTYYLIFGLLIIVKFIAYDEVAFDMLLLLSFFICFDYIDKFEINKRLISKVIDVSSWLFLLQIVICTFMYRTGKIFCLIYDVNYIGFFICLLTFYYFYINKKRYILWLILGLFTFSRAYILGMLSFVIVYLFCVRKKVISINKKNVCKIFILGQILLFPLSYIFTSYFESIDYKYIHRTGFSRIKTLIDGSNYNRFLANIFAYESLNIKTFFIGVDEKNYIGTTYIANGILNPHNTFLAMSTKYGVLIGCLYISKYITIIKKYYYYDELPMCITLLIYCLFLGPSVFYGVEILLILLFFKMIMYQKDTELSHSGGS